MTLRKVVEAAGARADPNALRLTSTEFLSIALAATLAFVGWAEVARVELEPLLAAALRTHR
jgi:hypothetical protein